MIKAEKGKVVLTGTRSEIVKDFTTIIRSLLANDLINDKELCELAALASSMNDLSKAIGLDKMERITNIEVDQEELKKQMEEEK